MGTSPIDWHSCPRHSTLPRNNRPFWRKKLAANRARDLLVNRELRRWGWQVLRVWEHELELRRHEKRLVGRIRRALRRVPGF